jgi:UDP-2-acetamido-3-amino-2,3-dideoxy-glucuronate N-acetyltransferase
MAEKLLRIHSSAIVEDGSLLGAGTAVWHHCHIRSGATVGEDCVFGKNVFVDTGALIGSRVKIQNNVSVYLGVTIEDDVFVGPAAVFTNDRVPRAFSDHWIVTPTLIKRGFHRGERNDRLRQHRW